MNDDTVTIWAHNASGESWYACPWPDSLTDEHGTWEYPGEPYWLKTVEALNSYIDFCLRQGFTITIRVGG